VWTFFKTDYRDSPDATLMQAIARRQERAFAELYGRYNRQMHRYFFRMLGRDAARADDFTQELFLKIIEKPHLYDPARPFRTWLYALAANMCKNEYRRKKPADTGWAETADMEIEGSDLPEQLDRKLFESSLRLAIDTLGDTHRQCFVLRYQEELSVAEIAAILQCPEGTVKSRLHYALQKISERLTVFKD
jgi:RNA polymerase sigma-70 factor (ECF subfamily)